ncbi:MAG: hypothetical protein KC503_30520, partial [Myxococcales bacterium]|nr:hypothetical protein [Myxococcales bacterium]
MLTVLLALACAFGCTTRNPAAGGDASADAPIKAFDTGVRDVTVDRAVAPAPDFATPRPDATVDRAAPPAPDFSVPTSCKVHCDCGQGLMCSNGTCFPATTPVYCCDRGGCPSGKPCVNKLNQPGVCGSPRCQTACDCVQGEACLQGVCLAGTQKVYCCSKAGCPAGSACVLPTGQPSSCGAAPVCGSVCDCKSGEDCIGGVCAATSSPQIFCCSDPTCPAGKLCLEKSGGYGNCKAAPQCQRRCDCPQGQECIGTVCIATPLP